MEFKKKTLIWEENNEPPKSYIWVKKNGLAYEFNYTTHKWEESDLTFGKCEQEDEQVDEFIQECIDTLVISAQRIDPNIKNLNDLKAFLKENESEINSILVPSEIVEQMIEALSGTATITITGDDEAYVYTVKSAEIDEATGTPKSMELIAINKDHYDELIKLLTDEEESVPETPVLRYLDFPITEELRYSSINDLCTTNVLYDERDIIYSSNSSHLPKGTENGTYYCLYGYTDANISASTFLNSINIIDVTSTVSQINFEMYAILYGFCSNNFQQYSYNNLSDFIRNRNVYLVDGLKYDNKNVYLVKVVPSNWSSGGVFVPIVYTKLS